MEVEWIQEIKRINFHSNLSLSLRNFIKGPYLGIKTKSSEYIYLFRHGPNFKRMEKSEIQFCRNIGCKIIIIEGFSQYRIRLSPE